MSILFNSEGDGGNDLGPDKIIEAVYTNESIFEIDEAVMGTPRLEDHGEGTFTDLYVEIPLNVSADMDLSPLVYDVPDSPTLDGRFGRLARLFGVDQIEDIGELSGQIIPLEWFDGYPRPAVNRLREAENKQDIQ